MGKLGWVVLFGTALSATSASAIELTREAETNTPAAKVWATVGDFCGIGVWHPAVEKCVESQKDGVPIRTLTLAGGGGTLVEALVSRDDKGMTYTYSILDGPLPVANYQSTLSVAADGDGSEIRWRGTFDAKDASDAEAEKVIAGIYESGIKALAEKTQP
jgi:hypothetical protein